MSEPLLTAFRGDTVTYDLSRPYVIGMPQSPSHPRYWHALPRRHGDNTREDGSSAANDVIMLGTHVGTHIDALGHVSYRGELYGGASAADAQVGGRLRSHGVEEIPPLIGRGIMLDIPAALGVETCEPGYEISPEDLDRAVERQGTTPGRGDVILIRSGWAQRWDDGDAYVGHDSGVPGVSEAGARWLADQQPRAAGADSIAFERLAPGAGHAHLPAHKVLLVDAGVNLIETMNLEGLAADEVHEFLFVGVPLPLVGATGSPMRPLAVVTDDR